MEVANSLDKEIAHYLGYLTTKQKKVVLNIIKSFAKGEEAWIDDIEYIVEMDKRYKDLETGKLDGLQLDDIAPKARLALKSREHPKS